MRVLVVEDEPALQEQLKARLTQASYSVDVEGDGEGGLFQIQNTEYDLAIIDIGLPKLTGIELIQQARADGCKTPIIVLTARGSWTDKVDGLEAGADDYLVKPFHEEELMARLNALLRRSAGMASPVVTAGPLSLNTAKQSLSVDGTNIDLTSFEYKVIEYLMLNPDSVVSKIELTEHIYDQDFDRDSNVIEVFVGRLRKKIDPKNTLKPIETLRGRGYRFALQRD